MEFGFFLSGSHNKFNTIRFKYFFCFNSISIICSTCLQTKSSPQKACSMKFKGKLKAQTKRRKIVQHFRMTDKKKIVFRQKY